MNPLEALGKLPGVKSLPKPARYAVGIAGVGALGYVVYRYVTKGGGGESGDPETAGAGPADFTDYPGDGTSPPITSTPVGQPTDPGGFIQPTTDDAWVRDAIEKMFTAGYTDTALVARVLGSWLQGVELNTSDEVTLVRTAVALAGRPPSGDHPFRQKAPTTTTPAPTTPTPAPAAPAVQVIQDTWTVSRGETLNSIASKLRSKYKNYPVTWQDLYNANRAVIGKNPNKIKPGQTLRVPH